MRTRSLTVRMLALSLCVLPALGLKSVPAAAQQPIDFPPAAFLPVVARHAGYLDDVVGVAAGRNFTCAVTESGGVFCWGENEHGQLGDGSTVGHLRPAPVQRLASGVRSVVAGDWGHTCALTQDGAVLCWGFNGHGQLGDNTRIDRHTPVGVAGLTSGIGVLTAGHGHTCAVSEMGSVFCWGHNDTYQLGNGSQQKRLFPGVVPGLTHGAGTVGAGFWHSCASTANGVSCWGSNENGELGNGSTRKGKRPVEVIGLSQGIVALAAGVYFTCGVTDNSQVLCWGANDVGQLGNGSGKGHARPVSVRGLAGPVSSVAAGDTFACALLQIGFVQCWGNNGDGQLGDGTTEIRTTPTTVVGLSNVTAIAAGRAHTCAVTEAGNVYCWGSNAYGQLGDDTTQDRVLPGAVWAAK